MVQARCRWVVRGRRSSSRNGLACGSGLVQADTCQCRHVRLGVPWPSVVQSSRHPEPTRRLCAAMLLPHQVAAASGASCLQGGVVSPGIRCPSSSSSGLVCLVARPACLGSTACSGPRPNAAPAGLACGAAHAWASGCCGSTSNGAACCGVAWSGTPVHYNGMSPGPTCTLGSCIDTACPGAVASAA